MAQSNDLSQLVCPEFGNIGQEKGKGGHQAPNAETLHGGSCVAESIVVALRKSLKASQKHLGRNRFSFERKLQDFVVKVAGEFHGFGVMLLDFFGGLAGFACLRPRIVDNFFARGRMYKSALAEDIQRAFDSPVFVFGECHQYGAYP